MQLWPPSAWLAGGLVVLPSWCGSRAPAYRAPVVPQDWSPCPRSPAAFLCPWYSARLPATLWSRIEERRSPGPNPCVPRSHASIAPTVGLPTLLPTLLGLFPVVLGHLCPCWDVVVPSGGCPPQVAFCDRLAGQGEAGDVP